MHRLFLVVGLLLALVASIGTGPVSPAMPGQLDPPLAGGMGWP